MLYKQFKELKLSSLGFGTMRLPLIPGGREQDIDQETLDRMAIRGRAFILPISFQDIRSSRA